MSGDPNKQAASLWTTPVKTAASPLKQAEIDTTVTAENLLEAVKNARPRAAAFVRPITEALLRKSV